MMLETGYPHGKEWNWIPISHHTQKTNSKLYKDLNIRPETVKSSEENRANLLDIGGGIFFTLTSKAQVTKNENK